MSQEQEISKKRFRKRKRFLFYFLLPITLFVLTLQLSIVQNFIADRLTAFLSGKIEANVSIDSVDFSIRRGVELQSLTLSEIQGDTILYAKSFKISLNRSLLSILSNELDLKEVELSGGRISLAKEIGDSQNNLSLLLSKLSSGKSEESKKSPSSFLFNVETLNLEDFRLSILDKNDGQEQVFSIGNGSIEIERLDLANNDIIIRGIDLVQPVIRITKSKAGLTVENTVEELDEVLDEVLEDDNLERRPFIAELRRLTITDGIFSYNDKEVPIDFAQESIDFKHLELSALTLDVVNVVYEDGFSLGADLKTLSFVDDKGFVVEQFSCDSIQMNNRSVRFPSIELRTDKSLVNQSIELKFRSYKDFNQFTDKVIIQSDLNASRVAFSDLMHFVEPLSSNPFFRQNRSEVASISGRYFGRINNLNAKDVDLTIGRGLSLKGNINTRNITDKSAALVNFGLKELNTSIDYLHKLVPSFEPPDNFYNLGKIRFKGRFDGYFKDFVAYGQLDTEIGRANMDMRLDVANGTENANYSGELSLTNFDLSRWSGNQDLGIITTRSKVENGKGLTPESIEADLFAVVESFTFKEYEYKDFEIDGVLKEKAFDGLFSIDQEDVSFLFEGVAKFDDGVPTLAFDAKVKELDLQAINLSKEAWSFKGNIDINTQGSSINNFIGNVVASDIEIIKTDSLYQLDTVSVKSYISFRGRELELFSDIADGEIIGDFQFEKVAEVAKKILVQNYPFHTKSWSYDSNVDLLNQDFDFRLKVRDSKNIFDLAGLPGLNIQGLQSKGKMSNSDNSIDFEAIIAALRINGNEFYDSHINISSLGERGNIFVGIDSSLIGGLQLNPVSLETELKGDSIKFELETDDIIDSLEKINIVGHLDPHPKGYRLNLDENEWNMLGTLWDFDATNQIVFGKEYINIENFSLTDGSRKISFYDINEKGIQLEMENFDFLLIDGLINFDKIRFSGPGDVYLSVENIFKPNPNGMLNVSIPDFRLNNVKYGSLEVTALKSTEDMIRANVSILRDTMSILVAGDYNLQSKIVEANAKIKDVPMEIFEFIINEGISGTRGTGDAKARLYGPVDNLQLNGDALIKKFAVTVDYLGATFLADQQTLKITEDYIDATGGIITDPEGNTATMTGGLRHSMFRDYRQDLVIETQNGIVLDTDKQDNLYYYGFGKGRMRAEFSGKFEATNLVITAVTGPGTELNIPVGAVAEGYDESFIKFIDRKELNKKIQDRFNEDFEIKGIDIQMNITLTPDAKVSIIFNEALGDIVVGYGQGDLQVDLSRTGDFNVFGEYEIERGEYLFTALGLVAKSFKVDRGGLIKWTGDPIDATLDFEGYYEVDAPLETFIAEYLFDDQLRALARNKTPVALKMDLGGRLYKPEVNFDLGFPELTGELKAYAENKIRTLRQNKIALNSQVVGLLAFQTFLPDNNLVSNDVLGSTNFLQTAGVSTISEFLSSQLSRLFTGLFEAALTENGLIAGIDFDIGLVKNSSLFQQNDTGFAPDEIEINFKNRFRFLGERLSLNLGGNYVRQSVLNNGSFFGVDFALEYYITDDRKLKLRMYGRNDVDQFIENGRQQQYGFGIGYRNEFGTLADFQEGLKKSIKETVEEGLQ